MSIKQSADTQSFTVSLMNATSVAKALILYMVLVLLLFIIQHFDSEHQSFYYYFQLFTLAAFCIQFYVFQKIYTLSKTITINSDKIMIQGNNSIVINISDIKNYAILKTRRPATITISITLHNNDVIPLSDSLGSDLSEFADAFDQMMKSLGK